MQYFIHYYFSFYFIYIQKNMASRSTDYQNSEIKIIQMHVTANDDRQAGTQKKAKL